MEVMDACAHLTALISDSCPTKVWLALPVRISQSLAVASHAPETKVCRLGDKERLGGRAMREVLMETDSIDSPHDISSVITKLHNPDTRLDIPQHTGHIPTTGHDLPIIQEPTTTQIARMGTQFPGAVDPSTVWSPQIIDGTDVIQAATGDKVSRGSIGTGHDPR